MLLGLYKEAAGVTPWSYEAKNGPLWSNATAALISLDHLPARDENFLLYGTNEELWRIEYEDPIFSSRQFIGQVVEINREEKYLILDSNGLKRRLNVAKILGAKSYSKPWKNKQGAMKYALFTFEEISATERKVSWRVLPDDRSKTLLEALAITDLSPREGELKEATGNEPPVDSQESPLPSWKKMLGEKVSVRITEEESFKEYYLVVDHLSWDPRTNIAEIGSKGLTLSSPPENLIVNLL